MCGEISCHSHFKEAYYTVACGRMFAIGTQLPRAYGTQLPR